MPPIAEIQEKLQEAALSGWLFYDHHNRDPLAYRILRFEAPRTPTRRWFYFIPAAGEARALVHRIEAGMLDALPGSRQTYSSWQTLFDGLGAILQGATRVAMQYSPDCAIPYVSLVDGGMIDLVRRLGAKVESSADLVQHFEARWTDAQLDSHLEAGRLVDSIRRAAFEKITASLQTCQFTSEYEIQQFIRECFEKGGLITDHGPIVAVNANASNPHYEPSASQNQPIRPGDLVLIDLWAKLAKPEAVYYDITWTGYCGLQAPAEMLRVFEIVRGARDAAVSFVQKRIVNREPIQGFEVDDAARGYISERDCGEFFVHRTGHSIGTEVHGNGANMDNLESHDTRQIIPRTCFSIEPGVYLEKFGIRSEVNVFVSERDARVTGESQQVLLLL